MYKKFLNLLILVLISLQANAYNGGKAYTFNTDTSLDSDELRLVYDSLKVSRDRNFEVLESIFRCSDREYYYIPSHADSDANGCFDILTYMESLSPKVLTPSFAGATTVTVQGDIGYDTSSYKNTQDGKGEFLGDTLCKNEYGSRARAARSYDLKFLSSQKGSISGYVFEPEIISGILHKSTTTGSAEDCANYTSTVANWDKVSIDGTTNSTCSTTTTIMCVKE